MNKFVNLKATGEKYLKFYFYFVENIKVNFQNKSIDVIIFERKILCVKTQLLLKKFHKSFAFHWLVTRKYNNAILTKQQTAFGSKYLRFKLFPEIINQISKN